MTDTAPQELTFSRRTERVNPSPTVAFREWTAKLRAEGRSVIDLSIGEPDFDTPDFIISAAEDAMRSGFTHYVNSRGIGELRQAIGDKLRAENGLNYDPEREVVVTVGGKQALFSTILALVEEGDEVLVLEPAWVSYKPCIRLAGAEPVSVPLSLEDNFQVTEELLNDYVSERTKLIIVNSPNNPTGRVLTPSELETLASFALREGLWVISDEIYEKLLFDQQEHVSIAGLPGMKSSTVVINGLSKAYAMTGWRLGYMAAPSSVVDAMLKIHQHSVTCAPSFGQKAAAVALQGSQDEVQGMVAQFEARRDVMVQGLQAIPGVTCPPIQGAFYAFPDISGLGLSSMELAEKLLLEGGVASVPGIAFGESCDNHLRFCFASSQEELAEALERFLDVANALLD